MEAAEFAFAPVCGPSGCDMSDTLQGPARRPQLDQGRLGSLARQLIERTPEYDTHDVHGAPPAPVSYGIWPTKSA
jgi:hypothetical protein